MEYMRLMKAGATLKDLAEALDINVTTTFYWRHKILTARKDGKSDAVLEEHTQADETFTYLNTKGNKNANNNLHVHKPTNRAPDYKSARKSGHMGMTGSHAATQEAWSQGDLACWEAWQCPLCSKMERPERDGLPCICLWVAW